MEQRSSPWREPIVWLMIVLVGAVVAGSIVMLDVASSDGPMDVVPDEVRRTGQIQEADLGPDAAAAARNLTAIVRIDPAKGFVEVLPVSGDFDHARPLRLGLHHPTRAADDLQVDLLPHATGWRADARPGGDHDWLLQLTPADGMSWRLRGRLPRGQLATRIQPALEDGRPAQE